MNIGISDHKHIAIANRRGVASQKRFPINDRMIYKHGLGCCPYANKAYTNLAMFIQLMMKFNTFLPNKLISKSIHT